MYQKDKSTESEATFRQTSGRCKRVLEAAKLEYANKLNESITSQKPGSRDFWKIANSVLNKDKSGEPPLFNGPEVLSPASDKAKLFAENICKNSNLDGSFISLSIVPSRTNLKLHIITVTPKMVKKLIRSLDLSKASGRYCISVVVLTKCQPELSYILAELFSQCLKESYCQIVRRFHPWSRYLRMLGKGLQFSCRPVSLLSVVCKNFENFFNNKIVDD